MPVQPGTTLGPFRIIALLGRGGMASVYKAYQAKLDRHVALKVLPQEFLHDPTFAKRFEREAMVVAKLEHPNIVPIYDYGIDDGIPWMSMRMLPVGSLADLLKQGRLDRRRVVAILTQVAEALDHAHANGVIHRDVKPSNVLLDDKERAYVGDFGLAHMAEASVVLTRTGTMAGTPHYMAPEQALGKKVDHRADIYALGIVAYEMLTGVVPFSADTPVAVLMKHANEPLPIPPSDQVPDSLLQPVLKALAKDPSDRWESAGAFAAGLARGLDEVVSGSTVLASGRARVVTAPEPPTTVNVRRLGRAPGDQPVATPQVGQDSRVLLSSTTRWLLGVAGVAALAVVVGFVVANWLRDDPSPAGNAPVQTAQLAPPPDARGVPNQVVSTPEAVPVEVPTPSEPQAPTEQVTPQSTPEPIEAGPSPAPDPAQVNLGELQPLTGAEANSTSSPEPNTTDGGGIISSRNRVEQARARFGFDAAASPAEWRHYGRDRANTRSSSLGQIDEQNVGNLELTWIRPTQRGPGLWSTPLMVGGVLYAPNGVGVVEAFDPATGSTIWTETPRGGESLDSSAGGGPAVAYHAGFDRLFGVRGTSLFALDPQTGVFIFSTAVGIRPGPGDRWHAPPVIAGDLAGC